MKKAILLIICFISAQFIYGQEALPEQQGAPPEYFQLTKEALSLFKEKSYKESAAKYSAAFKTFGWTGYVNDRYNAAAAWAQAGVSDSAFFNLDKIAGKGKFTDYDRISADKNFAPLYNDKRWQPVLNLVKSNKEWSDATFNKVLSRELDSMYMMDQKWRNLLGRMNHNKSDSLAMDSVRRKVLLTDSLNYLKVKGIFSKYGFPNYDLVGNKSTFHFWLLVQHQERHADFQETVLKAMKKEVDKELAPAAEYGYLLDRVKVNRGELQVYGTQMKMNAAGTSYEPNPVFEPEKLNERRKSLGLSPVDVYIDLMNKRYFGVPKKK